MYRRRFAVPPSFGPDRVRVAFQYLPFSPVDLALLLVPAWLYARGRKWSNYEEITGVVCAVGSIEILRRVLPPSMNPRLTSVRVTRYRASVTPYWVIDIP